MGQAGIPALHAAALEPDLFQSVKLFRTPQSWAAVIHTRLASLPISQVIHGALLTYDLPDLATMLGTKLRGYPESLPGNLGIEARRASKGVCVKHRSPKR